MDAKWKSNVFALLLASVSCFSAQAQTTLGEILDKGGHVLEKDELTKTLVGANFSGVRASGGTIDASVNADGRIGGYLQNPGRAALNFIGVWKIADDGRFCFDYKANAPNTLPATACTYYFQLGDEYFVSSSKSDLAASVTPRKIRH
ncbi:hypothetical protein [Zoogloea sp. LCSB751]|uniref:hypothetical protein n=1 Tax=Zoogloea sp. LCSB751 TaxID=1965277 RepID=UPI0011165E91|nr:hypothetical protein [Zoogloea sp. LCSB751]